MIFVCVRNYFCKIRSFIHMSRGEHLAVLNTYDSFFICKAMQNIFASKQKSEKQIKIKWLTKDSGKETSYHYDYEQKIGENN